MVRKQYNNGGDRCNDVEALKILSHSEHFPTLYAFEKNDYFYMERAKGESLFYISQKNESVDIDEIYEAIMTAFGEMLKAGFVDHDTKLEDIFWDNRTKKLTWIDLELCQKISLSDPVAYSFPHLNNIVEELNFYFGLELTEKFDNWKVKILGQ